MRMDELEQLSQHDITSMPGEMLVDITEIKVDNFAPAEVRFRCFLDQIKNPYCFLYDGTPVRISFSDQNHTLQERMVRYFVSRKQV